MLNKNNIIDPGDLKIISAAFPAMQAGEYVIHVEQTLKLKDNKSTLFENKETSFSVAAPRFSFVDEVHSSYPPKGTGSYETSLPHVIFKRKTLPWERSLSDTSAKGTPWLALLLFDAEEIRDNDILLQAVTLKKILEPGTNIFPPALSLNPIEEEERKKKETDSDVPLYNIIDVPCGLLNDVAPYENELPYLAHARQVDTSDKETGGIDAKGWFSVIVGNRLPANNKKNTVFLVSLEGHKMNINRDALLKPENSTKKVRLVVLHSWEFTCQGQSFVSLVHKIDDHAGTLKITPPATISDSVKKIFAYGYTAVNHQLRNGGNTISWYRGPLVPAQIPRPDVINYKDADAALMFDEQTTMLDISHASAWQMGRILALQSPGYMEAMSNWKKNFDRDVRLTKARELLGKRFKEEISFDDDIENANSNDAANEGKMLFTNVVSKVETDDLLNCMIAELWQQKSNING